MLAVITLPWDRLTRLNLRAAVDIVIIAVIIYYLLNLLKGTRAVQMAAAIALLVLFYYGARWARLEMVEWLLTTLLPYFAIALIILFQPEIRRALSRLGHNPFWRRFSSLEPAGGYDDLVLAASYFSQNRIGALIVIERDVGLKTYIESGIRLDAELSYDLLLAVFHAGSPLHDGAAIIQGSRIAAAACFLPLSLSQAISSQLGTRHRAAIGVTEESDAVTLVVSEQTTQISLATGGTIEMDLTPERLSERLAKLFGRFGGSVALPSPPPGAATAAAPK
jgi:diadenylate cyclase